MEPDEKILQAIKAYEEERYDDAERLSAEIVRSDAGNFRAYNLLGMSLHERGLSEQGILAVAKALELNPDYAGAHNNLAAIYKETKNLELALSSLDKAIALVPDAAEFYLSKALILSDMGNHEGAIESFEKSLSLNPASPDAYTGLGDALSELGRPSEALEKHNKAVQLHPGHITAWLNAARALSDLQRYDEALIACGKALALNPELAETWLGRGNVLHKLYRYDEALKAYDRALALKSDFAGAWLGRGNVFEALNRHREALEAYEHALAFNSGLAGAWLGKGNVMRSLARHAEAFLAYDRVLKLKPDMGFVHGDRLHAKMQICDWENYDDECFNIVARVRNSLPAAAPFVFLSLPSLPADQLQCARIFIAKKRSPGGPLWHGEIYSHDRIRIAYLSADFRDHAVWRLMAGVFEHHDKSRFETTAISLGADNGSPQRTRAMKSFDRFIDVHGCSDREAAEAIRELEIDIAVDLTGFTRDMRMNILASRPAPVLVNYLGYAGTMGADFVDYLVADKTVIPAGAERYYSEKVAYLPDSYFASDGSLAVPETGQTRSEAGLPDNGFVFCSFINSYKITPDIFSVWMKLLRQIGGSVLWLVEGDASANLKREAEARGVAPGRLVFAPRRKFEDYLAQHRLADLFLDTIHFNAHTTASHALWMGLPVVTCAGSTMASRGGASLLNAVGLPEMATKSLEEYEALAVTLARDPERLASVKAALMRNRATHPLFDTARYTRHLEAAYTAMWCRTQNGEAPESFSVGSIGKV